MKVPEAMGEHHEEHQFLTLKKETKKEMIIKKLIDLISQSHFKEGDKLPSENKLMKAMEVSRSPVREALHSLTTLGIIKAQQGRGYFIKGAPDVFSVPNGNLANIFAKKETFTDLLEVRSVLEKAIANRAIERATSEDIENLENIMEEIKKAAQERDRISDVTIKLHLGIAKCTHNPLFVQLMRKIVPLIVNKADQADLMAEEDYRMHKGVVDMLKSEDQEGIKVWVEDHLDYMRQKYSGS